MRMSRNEQYVFGCRYSSKSSCVLKLFHLRQPSSRLGASLFSLFDLFLLWNLLPFFRQHSWAIGPLSLRDVSDPCFPVPSLRLTAITIIFPLNTLKRNVFQMWSIPASQPASWSVWRINRGGGRQIFKKIALQNKYKTKEQEASI